MTSPEPGAAPRLADARCFPVDLHVPSREFSFVELDTDVLERATFLDTRIGIATSGARTHTAEAVLKLPVPHVGPAWLFHTSFCCSTLLARALHLPPYQAVLKEPLVLRRLGDARYAGWTTDGLEEAAVRLLARPWHPDGAVVLKPTHAALNVAADLLGASSDSRGLVLTSSLDDFLVSNLKKSEETQRKIPELVQRALQACDLARRLPAEAFGPPDLLAAAALQWAAQREICLDLFEQFGPGVLRVLDAADLLEDLPGVAWQCAQWLALPAPAAALQARVALIAAQNAKAVDSAYGPSRRAADAQWVRSQCGGAIARALEWFGRIVRPAMRPAAFDLANHAPFLLRHV